MRRRELGFFFFSDSKVFCLGWLFYDEEIEVRREVIVKVIRNIEGRG